MANTYIAFWHRRQMEITAETTREAQEKAAEAFKARKPWEVSVMLAAKADGVPVVHVPDF